MRLAEDDRVGCLPQPYVNPSTTAAAVLEDGAPTVAGKGREISAGFNEISPTQVASENTIMRSKTSSQMTAPLFPSDESLASAGLH